MSSLSPAILEKVSGLKLSSDRWTIKKVLSVVGYLRTGCYIFNKRIPLSGKILIFENLIYGFQKNIKSTSNSYIGLQVGLIILSLIQIQSFLLLTNYVSKSINAIFPVLQMKFEVVTIFFDPCRISISYIFVTHYSQNSM